MIIRLDPAAPASASEQLVAQVVAAIESAELAAGDRLPTIRSLANDLRLSPGTVARAYAELERAGWIVTQGRRGTTVATRRPAGYGRPVLDAAAALAAASSRAQLSPADAHRALDIALARLARAAT